MSGFTVKDLLSSDPKMKKKKIPLESEPDPISITCLPSLAPEEPLIDRSLLKKPKPNVEDLIEINK